MSLLQIGLLESIFHGTSLLSELPSGMLADRFSYKANLYAGRLAAIVSAFLMLWGQGNFWIYAAAMVVNAWAYNFDSGTSTALLYDSVVAAGLKDKYLKFSSILAGVGETTRSLGAVLAGFLLHGHLEVTYYIVIASSILALFFIWQMKEPLETSPADEERLTLGKISKVVIGEFQTNPALLVWMLVFEWMAACFCMYYFYYQNQLPDLTGWQIALVMLLGTAVNLGATYLASQIGKTYHSLKLFPFLTFCMGASLLAVLWASPLIFILIYLITNSLYALYQPIFYKDIQEVLCVLPC